MNAMSSPSLVLQRHPRPGRSIGALLRTTLRALQLHWRAYQSQRREAHALIAIGDMDLHMLQDIGAPDELISRAAAGRSPSHWRDTPFQLLVVTGAIAVIATATLTSAAQAAPAQPPCGAYAETQMAGVFTGEFINGAPVYRFPAVVVTSSRKAKGGEGKARSMPPRQTHATNARVPA